MSNGLLATSGHASPTTNQSLHRLVSNQALQASLLTRLRSLPCAVLDNTFNRIYD